ncbi:MAG: hypothetical protein JSV80_16300 [Acidobacteriota bacterium]|nr:MAG: hypothetical protein JSV80_16300 [Acidobacteriota bacterium]
MGRGCSNSPGLARDDGRSLTACGSLRVVWEGPQLVEHSLALVNRQLYLELLRRGHELRLLPTAGEGPPTDAQSARLAARFMAADRRSCRRSRLPSMATSVQPS